MTSLLLCAMLCALSGRLQSSYWCDIEPKIYGLGALRVCGPLSCMVSMALQGAVPLRVDGTARAFWSSHGGARLEDLVCGTSTCVLRIHYAATAFITASNAERLLVFRAQHTSLSTLLEGTPRHCSLLPATTTYNGFRLASSLPWTVESCFSHRTFSL